MLLFYFHVQWSLVCDEAYKSKFAQSAFMGGVGVGAVTLGAFADSFGRYKCIVCTLILLSIIFSKTGSVKSEVFDD